MGERISHDKLYKRLKKLEDDYIKSVDETDGQTVETFLTNFLSGSWDYNAQNIADIKAVFSDYEKGSIPKELFSGSFNEMTDSLHFNFKNWTKTNAILCCIKNTAQP